MITTRILSLSQKGKKKSKYRRKIHIKRIERALGGQSISKLGQNSVDLRISYPNDFT